MDSSTLLDYALFQLTPTRTRCDLLLFYGGKSEKLASGLFEPFISHLKFAKDEISKGGYSIKLRPPPDNITPWFTKGTFERFVRFVSTPALLERFVSLETEISQIESSVQANELSSSNVAGQVEEDCGFSANANARKSNDSSKPKNEIEKSDDPIQEENSKIQLQRLLETRKALLRKEQAMAYARGLVAGFDSDSTDDLISFADTFGASRLREACINFKELCKKKRGDGLWMEELAAMQTCPTSDLPLLGTSGIVFSDNINALNPHTALNFTNEGVSTADFAPNISLDASRSDSMSSHASLDSKKDDNLVTPDQMPSSTAKVQVPMPWPHQIPPYMYNFQGPIPQLPPYQGFPYPTLLAIPPHYPKTMHWPPSVKEPTPAKKEKYLNKKGREDSGDDGQTESTDSEVDSDSDSYIVQDRKHSSKDTSQRKKHRKKSSKTVVIRNINYITPTRKKGEKGGVSDSSSDKDEFIDEDCLRQQVDDAVGSLEKLHKSNSSNCKKKGGDKISHFANGSDASAQDSDDGLVSNSSGGGKANENWDAFQHILMRAEEPFVNGVETLHPLDVQNGQGTHRSSRDGISFATNPAMDLESEKVPKQVKVVADSFVITERDGQSEDRVVMGDFAKAENLRPIMKRRDSTDEDFIISPRFEESGSGFGGILSPFAAESCTVMPPKGEDWFIVDHSGKPENIDAASTQTVPNSDYLLPLEDDCSNAQKNRKDALIDDSFMVRAQLPADDLYDSQWKTDINVAADLTLSSQAENGAVQDTQEVLDAYEPNDLCMVLERDSGHFESTRESWTTDPGLDISFMEADRRSSNVESGDHAHKKLLSNSDGSIIRKNETNGRKILDKETKSKISSGSLGKSKNDMMLTGKKSSVVSRSMVQKSKLEKEEEMRKRMEELLIQRQKRIAERTAAGGFTQATAKKAPYESKTVKGSIKFEKSQSHTTTQRTSRTNSVKVRAA